jgi:hypothetical protein
LAGERRVAGFQRKNSVLSFKGDVFDMVGEIFSSNIESGKAEHVLKRKLRLNLPIEEISLYTYINDFN